MESCNSGSLQSSSGGDEEYDSRAAVSVPTFVTTRPTNPPPNPPMFDPLSNYFLNPNIPWAGPEAPRSDPNSIINNIVPSFQTPAENTNSISFNDAPPPQNHNQAAARNSKKRSRASRRAPTTVLTTDTANFRAMVQEFTGVPAPPFSNPPFQRSKLDLCATAPPYLRRPLPQKFQPPFLGPSSSLLTSNAIPASGTTNSANSTTPISYQLPITQSSNLFNFPLQTNKRIPFSDSYNLGSDELHSSFKNNGGFDDFGLGRHDYDEISNNSENLGNNLMRPVAGDPDHQSHHVNGDYSFSRRKMNSLDGENGPGNDDVGTRGEGMAESWICANSD